MCRSINDITSCSKILSGVNKIHYIWKEWENRHGFKNLCCIRSCAEHDLKEYFEFHEWAYVIALFCMSYFKRSAKQVGER